MVTWSSSTGSVYIGADGDNMGTRVARMIISGDRAKATALSHTILKGQKAVVDWTKRVFDATPIISGGDDTLVVVKAHKFDPSKIEAMRSIYATVTSNTISAGIGSTMEEAAKALVIAKGTGKDKAVFWDDSMQEQYDQIVHDKCNELVTKCRAAGAKEEGIITDLIYAGSYGLAKASHERGMQYWNHVAKSARDSGRLDLHKHAMLMSRKHRMDLYKKRKKYIHSKVGTALINIRNTQPKRNYLGSKARAAIMARRLATKSPYRRGP